MYKSKEKWVNQVQQDVEATRQYLDSMERMKQREIDPLQDTLASSPVSGKEKEAYLRVLAASAVETPDYRQAESVARKQEQDSAWDKIYEEREKALKREYEM